MTGSHEVRGSNPLISTKNTKGAPPAPFSLPICTLTNLEQRSRQSIALL